MLPLAALLTAAREARHWQRVCSLGARELARLRATHDRWAPIHTNAVDRGLDVEWLSTMLLSVEHDVATARFALRSARAKLVRWLATCENTAREVARMRDAARKPISTFPP